MGSGNDAIWNYHRLPQKCVLVTLNHRLGPFGLLGHPMLSGESKNGVSGNYLFLDLIASLEWIQKNIGGFGGATSYLEKLKRCYSTGAASGDSNVGGFLGYDGSGVYEGCCWDTDTSGTETACGSGTVTGVTGYETEELQDAVVIQSEGFAIGRTWNVTPGCNGGYPCLIGVNPCCVTTFPGDVTVAKTKPSLELIRNLEMQLDGKFYIDKSGNAVYESRFARHG